MKARRSATGGFSLVEVAIAIAIVAYVIFGIVGLLPSGMKAFRSANQQAGAANLLGNLAESIRSAGTADGRNFTWSFAGTPSSYLLGGAKSTTTWSALTINGTLPSKTVDGELRAVAVLTPPANASSEGTAILSVAWPVSANPVWDGTSLKWIHAENSSTLAIRFLPRLPRP